MNVEPTNAEHAQDGAKALRAHIRSTRNQGEERGIQARDLLADLMHLADKEGWNFDYELEGARGHHATEKESVQGGSLFRVGSLGRWIRAERRGAS